MSAAPQIVSSEKVIKDRLKNGQCIHCGVQTHEVVKKMFHKSKKIPLNIPGIVEHGRCMSASCQQAGNNIALDNKPSRISAQGVANAAGTAATLTGAVLTGLGIPGGEFMVTAGSSVLQSSSYAPQPVVSSNSSVQTMMEAQQQYTEQMMQALNQQQQAGPTMFGLSSSPSTSIQCPNHHFTEPSAVSNQCNFCGAFGYNFCVAGGSMVGLPPVQLGHLLSVPIPGLGGRSFANLPF